MEQENTKVKVYINEEPPAAAECLMEVTFHFVDGRPVMVSTPKKA